jgi:uroporphyrinogen-III decarboxylase
VRVLLRVPKSAARIFHPEISNLRSGSNPTPPPIPEQRQRVRHTLRRRGRLLPWRDRHKLILDTAFGIPDETPVENVRAMFSAARRYAG